MACAGADAVILPAVTLDGPSAAIGEFGGVAVSRDGTGGIVYIKNVEGVAHVFVARFIDDRWLAPERVDLGNPYEASSPRIAAADGGRLVVVWLTQISTADNRIQRALMSSTIDPGAGGFGPSYVIDFNVGEGQGADPSLALAATGEGIVAYRVVTNDFKTNGSLSTVPQLRPGDVLADIRIARYNGQEWSSPEVVNRDPLLSMRAPTALNGPQVAVGRGDDAVVAWQEPESSGIARIWARRVFGTTLGLVLPASPSVYASAPVTSDADAFDLSVSAFGEAKVVSRVLGAAGTSLTHTSLFVNTLPAGTLLSASQFTGAEPLPGASGGVGAPSVAVDEREQYRIAFTNGGVADVLSGSDLHGASPEVGLGPTGAGVGASAATTLNPEGGGVTAWPASVAPGVSGIGVREDFPAGGAQSGLMSGAYGGPVSGLDVGGSESGESIVGFRQGEAGAYEIVGERVTVPPPSFSLVIPPGWVKPGRARISWAGAEDAAGGVSYRLVVDGRIVTGAISGLTVLPDPRLLGSGVRHVQVLATDAAGQQTLSGERELMVDSQPPVAHVRHLGGRTVVVTVKDAQSGVLTRATRISFGDGVREAAHSTARHSYARPGRYTITVEMRDKVGNAVTAHLRVNVR